MKELKTIPKIIAIICSILLLLTIVLPYVTATGTLESVFDLGYSFSGLYDMMGGDSSALFPLTSYEAKNMSFFIFLLKVESCGYFLESVMGGDMLVLLIIGVALFILTIFVLFILLLTFSCQRKGIAIWVCTGIAFTTFLITNTLLSVSGLISDKLYKFGSAFYVFIFACIGLAGAATWMYFMDNKASAIVQNKVICGSCGNELVQGVIFCSRCGTPVANKVPEITTCPSCNTELSSEAKFCTACGTKVR